ncbi:MAG: NAD(P)H-hydrate dehydratase [Deltaproteobacteria bacterium]|nr:NAD(P)H-hydrate dehydratase [Deltaproteobacteria bacterium]
MNLYTIEEMQHMDDEAIEKHGVSPFSLMDQAGKGVSTLIASHYPKNLSVGILCGRGNNGGDGLVVARYLLQKGFQKILIILIPQIDNLKGEVLEHFKKIDQTKIKIYDHSHLELLKECDVIVDGLLGTGLKDEVRDPYKQIINYINALQKEVVAIDIPSGLQGNSGEPHGVAIKAKMTVCLAGAKVGLVLTQAASYVGKLHVIDIGIPKPLLNASKKLLTQEIITQLIPKRRVDAYKGSFGHILCVGGAYGMEGAIQMTALGALKVGAGLTTIASLSKLRTQSLEVMHQKLGFFWPWQLKKLFLKKKILALGPGLGISHKSKKILKFILKNYKDHLVIDADGLNCLSEIQKDADLEKLLKSRDHEPILTPHPGEFARLTHYKTEEIQKNRAECAFEYARKWNVILVLKGSGTVIASPRGEIFINPTGNPGMATAGMGDVLTGIISGFLGQGLNPLEAAQLGVYLHGLSGDHLKEKKGVAGFIASDLLEILPETIQFLSHLSA